jgi:uncharacterized protein YecE (DUF72 family)
MAAVYIGTSGYDYPEWAGPFYPQNLKRSDFLAYYAEVFNAVELNFAYYKIPAKSQMENMIRRSGGKLHFSIKANRRITHEVDPDRWKDTVAEYRQSIEPALEAGVLLSVLLQFPERYHYSPENRRYLSGLIDAFNGFPLVVEIRHRSWQRESVYEGLTGKNAAFCICDMPEKKNLPAFSPIVTGSAAYIRFHGRNAGNWYDTNARDRYDYNYSDKELKAFCPAIRTITGSAQLVQIYFNNHAKGQAAINAQKLQVLLR